MKPDLEAIRARAEKATEGPWHKSCVGTEGRNEWVIIDREDESDAYVIAEVIPFVPPNDGTWKHNADFIAHARSDIPALLAYIDSLERVREAAKNHSCLMGTAQLAAALAAVGEK